MSLDSIAPASAQNTTAPPQGTSRGENFSAKPAPALFASDCTGAGCHKGPQGLAKGQSAGSLAGFLREHYTNSRESAAALAGYLLKTPAGPAQPEPPARASRPAGSQSGSASGAPGWFPPQPNAPGASEPRPPRQVGGRATRAATHRGDEPAPEPSPPGERSRSVEPEPAKPIPPTRTQRGRQQPTAAAAPLAPAEPAPPQPAATAPPPPQFDIFD
jgi:hypothetical protein